MHIQFGILVASVAVMAASFAAMAFGEVHNVFAFYCLLGTAIVAAAITIGYAIWLALKSVRLCANWWRIKNGISKYSLQLSGIEVFCVKDNRVRGAFSIRNQTKRKIHVKKSYLCIHNQSLHVRGTNLLAEDIRPRVVTDTLKAAQHEKAVDIRFESDYVAGWQDGDVLVVSYLIQTGRCRGFFNVVCDTLLYVQNGQ